MRRRQCADQSVTCFHHRAKKHCSSCELWGSLSGHKKVAMAKPLPHASLYSTHFIMGDQAETLSISFHQLCSNAQSFLNVLRQPSNRRIASCSRLTSPAACSARPAFGRKTALYHVALVCCAQGVREHSSFHPNWLQANRLLSDLHCHFTLSYCIPAARSPRDVLARGARNRMRPCVARSCSPTVLNIRASLFATASRCLLWRSVTDDRSPSISTS
jgi:hypothetical protein